MAVKVPNDIRRFAIVNPEVEAVLQRCGKDTWDLVLIDLEGNWTRAVFVSKEYAEAVAEQLGLPLHEGWEEPRMAKRMNRRDHWNVPGGQKRAL